MTGNKRFYGSILTFVLSGFSLLSFSQVKIDGPECTPPGKDTGKSFNSIKKVCSVDKLHWREIRGASSRDLVLKNDPDHTVFLRRRINELQSCLIDYSDISVLVVKIFAETN